MMEAHGTIEVVAWTRASIRFAEKQPCDAGRRLLPKYNAAAIPRRSAPLAYPVQMAVK